jgi:hypothetical protein
MRGPQQLRQQRIGTTMSYKIIRFFANGSKETIRKGLTLEQAQKHCQDPERGVTMKEAYWIDENGREAAYTVRFEVKRKGQKGYHEYQAALFRIAQIDRDLPGNHTLQYRTVTHEE